MNIALRLSAAATLLTSALFAAPGHACSTTTPCEIADGEYFIAMPETYDAPPPAVFFLHGFGSTGPAIFRSRGGVADTMLARGYAVVAPAGLKREGRQGGRWAFHPWFPQNRDEVAFINAVRDAVVDEHGIDPDRTILSGFSVGGSMASYVACATPDAFAAYAPIGGNFWRPHPTECAGPVRMLHTHGWADGTVPLEGRVLRGDDSRDPDALIQGDIFHAMSVWRETNQCFQLKADRFEMDGPFWRRIWDRCAPGSALELAIFPGGHAIPKGWAEMTMDWFEAL